MAAIATERLHAGTVKDLLGVYGGLGSGRLVILGRPGAGKSGAAIHLLLDALTHRTAFGTPEERARIPVPVRFPLHGWDPHSEPLARWLAGRLTEDFELLRAREYGRDAAARLISGGYIAVILDGLDEMPKALHTVALRALDEQATFRLVVLTRSDEMEAAVGEGHLRGAAALELCSVQAEQAAEYLASAHIHPAPPPWQRLVEHLRAHPDGALGQALQTPLMVTLVRDTYRPGDPVDELTCGRRFASREDIENHLLDRVLPAAYAPSPGRPTPLYTLVQAQRWLGYLARRMNEDRIRDLAWWEIPRWTPAWPRILATVLVLDFVVVLVLKFVTGFVGGLEGALGAGLGFALTIGFMVELVGASYVRPPRYLGRLWWSETNNRANLVVGLVLGLIFGLVGGIVGGLVNLLTGGLVSGLLFGLVNVLMGGLVLGLVAGLAGVAGRAPRHLGRLRWSRTDIVMSLVAGLVAGLVVGLVAGLAHGFGTGLGLGLPAGLLSGLVAGLLLGFGWPSTAATSPIDPRTSWRRNCQFGLVVGLGVGLVTGIVNRLGTEIGTEIGGNLLALMVGLMVGFAAGPVSSPTWLATFASAQLRLRDEAPVRLLRFLEDARDRQVLRTVGQMYQFRHGQLQDRLAASTAPAHTP
ncbi:MAG: hypothetical protein ACRDTE_03395 [Pseudonocardiaceae bacterium]